MIARARGAARLARGGAEAVLAALLVAMFLAFLVQIAMRYVVGKPVGWTTEVSLLAWVWGILWGAALVLTEREEIRFDILHAAVFMRIERSAYLGIRMDWAFSIWLVFAVAMIIRHAAILWRAVRGETRS